ncbi:hypothetical protein CFPU101_20800 [Chroococcus sp. FPU101]|nr:hypothetical protein CFPU101_20800 [Chroococcus sp. FPU101]
MIDKSNSQSMIYEVYKKAKSNFVKNHLFYSKLYVLISKVIHKSNITYTLSLTLIANNFYSKTKNEIDINTVLLFS